jgi:phosphoribosylformylglycinamidine (FGAM) synthase-like amidotransferase family enzyme
LQRVSGVGEVWYSPLHQWERVGDEEQHYSSTCRTFECRWVNLKPLSQKCIWTNGLKNIITCPIAHGEGNFQINDFFHLSSFIEQDQIALAYIHADGSSADREYPVNPNGSVLDIAGICNPQDSVGTNAAPENHIHLAASTSLLGEQAEWIEVI